MTLGEILKICNADNIAIFDITTNKTILKMNNDFLTISLFAENFLNHTVVSINSDDNTIWLSIENA